MSSNSKKSLLERIRRGKATRERLVESNLSEGIAFQIAATRDERGWTQAQLAENAGIANNLPRLEDPEYGKQTLTTLKKLAHALDVALVVRFVPFSQYINWLSGTPFLDDGLRPDALAVPSFDREVEKCTFEVNSKYWHIQTMDSVTSGIVSQQKVSGVRENPSPIGVFSQVIEGTTERMAVNQ